MANEREDELLARKLRLQRGYDAGPETLLVLQGELASPWFLLLPAAVALVAGWPVSAVVLTVTALLVLAVGLTPHRRRLRGQPLLIAVERDALVLVHQGLGRGRPRVRVPFHEIATAWDLGSSLILELRDGTEQAIAFGARGSRTTGRAISACYHVLENRTAVPFPEHDPGAIHPWVEAFAAVLAERGVVTKPFPPEWRLHFWGAIARKGAPRAG